MRDNVYKISVIVTTYNWPSALRMVLEGLFAQVTNIPFEIIVADDGSGKETTQVINYFKEKNTVPVTQVWQVDAGFRAAAIRNRAIQAALGEYLIFLDGDCVPRKNFVARHFALAEKGFFVVGNRVLLNKAFTIFALSHMLPLYQWPFWKWSIARIKGYCNRLLPFLTLGAPYVRYSALKKWQGAKGCNLAAWKEDLLKVNGWEEQFEGWGYEDSDLVIRLLRSDIKRKEGRFYLPVIHLWHPENDRTRELENWARLEFNRKTTRVVAEKGLNQYFKNEGNERPCYKI
jgi:glycosyltransferase involved in cell wall biosynthesis